MTDTVKSPLQAMATPPMSARARAECARMLLEDINANAALSAHYAGLVPSYTYVEDLFHVETNLNAARLYLNAALQSRR
jgi:hypothetical protein